MLCGDDEPNVLQVLPAAAGFRAVFDENSERGYYTEPVACWFMVKHRDGTRHVHPGVCMGTIVDDATFAAGFLFVTGAHIDFVSREVALFKSTHKVAVQKAARLEARRIARQKAARRG